MRPKALIVINHYLPGYRYGGPVQSIAALVQTLHNKVDFYIVTKDHDFKSSERYANIPSDTWVQRDNCRVYYARKLNLATLRSVMRDLHPDTVYLNSMFAPTTRKVLFAMRLGLLPQTSVLLAPRGELAPAALSLKWGRKSVFLAIASAVDLYRGVQWHATAPHEVEHIRKFDHEAKIVMIPESIAAPADWTGTPTRASKNPGAVKLLFISRISRMKNPTFLLDLLPSLKGEIEVDIYGPLEDPMLWASCEAKIAALGPNCRVEYKGELPHPEVFRVLRGHHFFVLPTLGENFGHAIVEALLSGTPVVISDRTQWRNLAAHSAGFDLSLDDRAQWIATLQKCVDMDADEYEKFTVGALAYIEGSSRHDLEAYEALFRQAPGAHKAAHP